jgi:hypothetical protein
MVGRRTISAAGGNESYFMEDEPGGRGSFAYKMSLERRSAMVGIDDQSEQQMGWVSCPPRTDSTRLLAEATSACGADWPPVGRPCGRDPTSKQKPSMKGKPKQNHPRPRRGPASRWSALQRWHTNGDSTKTRTVYPIPVLQAHSWMRKTLQPQTGQPYLCKTAVLPGRLLIDPTGRISGVSVVVHDSAGKETK